LVTQCCGTLRNVSARQAEAQIPQDRKLLKTKVEEQKAVSKELHAWIEQREELEKIIVKQAHEKGKAQERK